MIISGSVITFPTGCKVSAAGLDLVRDDGSLAAGPAP